jgi:hypothetical protein
MRVTIWVTWFFTFRFLRRQFDRLVNVNSTLWLVFTVQPTLPVNRTFNRCPFEIPPLLLTRRGSHSMSGWHFDLNRFIKSSPTGFSTKGWSTMNRSATSSKGFSGKLSSLVSPEMSTNGLK